MSNDLISRSALLETIRAKYCAGCKCYPCGEVIAAIEVAPAVDAEPVRHGKWVEDDYGFYHCKCGWEFDEPEDSSYEYCPSCGAKMDGGK